MNLETLLVQTFTKGPFHADGNVGKLEDAVREWVASSSEQDPLFQALYKSIVLDQHAGRLPADFGAPVSTWLLCSSRCTA